ncbi:MAG: T9SS type A sorting domain-containing protein [Bacteroidota bacterium]
MKKTYIISVAVVLLFFLTSQIYSQAGSIDWSFGVNGIAKTITGNSEDFSTGVALYSDGKIVVCGTSRKATGNYDAAIIRLNSDGTIDQSFGTDGIVFTDNISGMLNIPYDIKIQNDDKIVIAGVLHSESNTEIFVNRYNYDGSLDNTFGTNGKVRFALSAPIICEALDIQADGKIVVLAYSNTNLVTVLVRFNYDGTIDNSFDGDGYALILLEGYATFGHAMKILNDGRIVVAGEVTYNFTSNIGVGVLNSDGSYDTSFSGDGQVVFEAIPGETNNANTILIQPDSKIIVLGSFDYDISPDYQGVTIIRFNADGTFDDSFSGDGFVITDLALGLVKLKKGYLQNDGKIIAVGAASSNGVDLYITVRFNSDGSLDNSFGLDGIWYFNVSGYFESIQTITVQPDNKIITAGAVINSNNTTDILIARQDESGSVDGTFGGVGFVEMNLVRGSGYPTNVSQQSDGKFLIGGTAFIDGEKFSLVRFNQNGSIDPTLDYDGVAYDRTDLNTFNYSTSMAIQSDNKIIVGGYSKINIYTYDFMLTRFNTDGSIDNTFGNNGIVTTDINSRNDYLEDIKLQSDHKIVGVGYSNTGTTTPNLILARYNSNGSIDNSFGINGIVEYNYPGYNLYGVSLSLLNDGKVVVSGDYIGSGVRGVFIARFNQDGSFDYTFDSDGILFTELPSVYISETHGLKVTGNGKILVCGRAVFTEEQGFVIRYNEDGSLDQSFGTNGILYLNIGGVLTSLTNIEVQNDGKIIVCGYHNYDAGTKSDLMLIRLNVDGSYDTSFNSSGIVFTDINSNSFDIATGLLLSGDNSIYVVGYTTVGNDYYTALIKYTGDGTSSVISNGIIPDKFELKQNYPNPFNPTTTISYKLQEASHVTLKVYDLLGKEVATLVDEYEQAGTYNAQFSTHQTNGGQVLNSQLSSGVYFYTIKTDNFTETRKMTLIK